MITVEEAKSILKNNSFAEKLQERKLISANGYYLAEDVISACDVPRFDNSAMDGYAIKLLPSTSDYKVTSVIAAGAPPPRPIEDFEAFRIFTGAPIPENADTVVQQEVCTVKDEILSFNPSNVKIGSHIRQAGSQTRKGELLLRKGAKLTPGKIALLASAGINQVKIFVPPTIAILVTGSEISEADPACEPYMIHDANGPALVASLHVLNVSGIHLVHVKDEFQALQQATNKLLNGYDILIISGGISTGDYDHVKSVLEAQDVKQLIYMVRQKPGKPFFAGKKNQKWIFGLPGNPAAVLTCFNQYVKPVINTMCGNQDCWTSSQQLSLLNEFTKKKGLTHFVKAKQENDAVRILKGQDSYDLSAFSDADCFIELNQEKETFLPGDIVNVYTL
jgi:molybdopterin molybdotransferase